MLAIILATAGRPAFLTSLLQRLALQSRRPDIVVVAPSKAGDMADNLPQIVERLPYTVMIVSGRSGLADQRNGCLDWLFDKYPECASSTSVIIALDDDFLPERRWLERCEAIFLANGSYAGVTGTLLADGASNAGYDEAEGDAILATGQPLLPATDWRRKPGMVEGLYGCNMAFRGSVARDLRFDANLPLYSWQEDFDFSSRLKLKGELYCSDELIGVHLATKTARTQGLRMGYSQIANLIYLARKGTCPPGRATKFILKNLLSNVARSIAFQEPYVDRRGRLRGNVIALAHLMVGRLKPSYILQL